MVKKLCKLTGCILCWRGWARAVGWRIGDGRLFAPRRVMRVEKIEATWPRLFEAEIFEELESSLVELCPGRSWPQLAILKAWQWGGSERVMVLSY
jgi:hypothetical protein